MQHISGLKNLHIKVTEKEYTDHSQLYKECITGEIKNSHYSLLHPWKIYIYNKDISRCMPGDTIQVSCHRARNTKKNDFSWFLCKEHVAATLFLTSKEKVALIKRPTWSIARLLWQKRNTMLDVFKHNSSSNTFSLASCIFLGNRTVIKQSLETKELFKKIGITHYLARSGLHLIIFMLVWRYILTLFFISHRKKVLALMTIGLAYSLLTWPSVSFFRALALFFLFSIATLNHMRAHVLYLLCLICTALLIYNPIQLFFLDFQLTFGLTCALMWHNYIENQIRLISTRNTTSRG